jgi:hypothetical protein
MTTASTASRITLLRLRVITPRRMAHVVTQANLTCVLATAVRLKSHILFAA